VPSQKEVQHIVSTTRSKTINKTTAVADFEASAAASRLAYEAASALRHQRADELAGAREALADVHAGWDQGDDTLPPDAEVQAQASISRATRLLAAAEVAERKAKAALVNTHTSLADALAPLIGDVLRIAPSVQAYRPTDTASELPSAVAVQTGPTKVDPRSGALSGTVEVIFTRNELHREAHASDFEAAAERHGVILSKVLAFTEQTGELFTDSVRLQVARLDLPIPAVEVGDAAEAAQALAREVAFRATDSTRFEVAAAQRSYFDDGTRFDVHVQADTAVVVSDRVARGGSRIGQQDTRTVVVEADLTGTPRSSAAIDTGSAWAHMAGAVLQGQAPGQFQRATDVLSSAVEGAQGLVIDGLGRIASASVVSVKGVLSGPKEQQTGVTVRARFEVVSQGGDAASSPSVSALPSQRKGRDPLEDLDGSSSHPGSRQ
jgi:hypothetical protein